MTSISPQRSHFNRPNMDFLENVGQRYLERRAYAAPQQLENFARKQFNTAEGDERHIGKSPTTAPSNDKREEKASLQKQLAEVTAKKPAKAESGSKFEIPTAAAGAVNSRRDSRHPSTAEAEDSGLTGRRKRGRLHSTASSRIAIEKQETFADASPHRRT